MVVYMDVVDKVKEDVYNKYKVTGTNWRLEGKNVWRFKGNLLSQKFKFSSNDSSSIRVSVETCFPESQQSTK